MKAVVLFSGGQDSTTCLCAAVKEFGASNVLALSVLYGQRHKAELEAGAAIAEKLGVKRMVTSLPVLSELGGALVDPTLELTTSGGIVDAAMPEGLPTSFVPGRNALFLSIAASVAVKVGARSIITGTCEADYSGYPDCRREFIDAMERALTLAMPSSVGPLEIRTPLMRLSKADTVRLARDIPRCWEMLALSVTCYHGERPGCGVCAACALRRKGFEEVDEVDPSA